MNKYIYIYQRWGHLYGKYGPLSMAMEHIWSSLYTWFTYYSNEDFHGHEYSSLPECLPGFFFLLPGELYLTNMVIISGVLLRRSEWFHKGVKWGRIDLMMPPMTHLFGSFKVFSFGSSIGNQSWDNSVFEILD